MTCEEWRNGYKTGFEDGYEKAKRDLQKNPLFPTYPNVLGNPETYCKVCGMNLTVPMGYVCFHDKCPTKITSGLKNTNSYTYKPTHLSPSSFDNGHDGDSGC